LIDFARHYGFQPEACRLYRAKTKQKDKVERRYRCIREDFLPTHPLVPQSECSTAPLVGKSARARHDPARRQRGFAEKGHLKMLPLAPFDRSQIITRVTLVAAAICVRRNHILKFFSPYFLINHPAQQSGGAPSKFPLL